jgi:hypothetical protein
MGALGRTAAAGLRTAAPVRAPGLISGQTSRVSDAHAPAPREAGTDRLPRRSWVLCGRSGFRPRDARWSSVGRVPARTSNDVGVDDRRAPARGCLHGLLQWIVRASVEQCADCVASAGLRSSTSQRRVHSTAQVQTRWGRPRSPCSDTSRNSPWCPRDPPSGLIISSRRRSERFEVCAPSARPR